MDVLNTEEAIRLGVIVAGPVLSVVGVFFAVSISASPYHNIVGKAIAFPLAPIVGLVLGADLAPRLLDDWGNWGVAMLFGHGFFYTWAVTAALTHDDSIHNFGNFASWAGPRIKRFIDKQKGGGAKPKTRIKLEDPVAVPEDRERK